MKVPAVFSEIVVETAVLQLPHRTDTVLYARKCDLTTITMVSEIAVALRT